MKINVITTIEINKDTLNENDLEHAYNIFRDIIDETHETKDLTSFLFVNADTNNEIENEIEQWNIKL